MWKSCLLNKSLKHKKCFYQPIPQLSIFCLIQGINYYPRINTYWSFIVQIGIFINLANNIVEPGHVLCNFNLDQLKAILLHMKKRFVNVT
jgi:hypothetical protein